MLINKATALSTLIIHSSHSQSVEYLNNIYPRFLSGLSIDVVGILVEYSILVQTTHLYKYNSIFMFTCIDLLNFSFDNTFHIFFCLGTSSEKCKR